MIRGIMQARCLAIMLSSIMSLLVSSCQVFGTPAYLLPARLKNIGDGGLISGRPCSAPCFWGIRPGITREAEALRILKEKKIFPYCQLIDNESQSGTRGYDCGHMVSVDFQFGTDLVDGVGFRPSNGMTVGEVVSKFGPPDHVLVSSTGTPEENLWVDAAMSYSQIRAIVYLPAFQGNRPIDPPPYSIVSSTKVAYVGYSDAIDYWRSLKLQSWKGFGDYPPTNP